MRRKTANEIRFWLFLGSAGACVIASVWFFGLAVEQFEAANEYGLGHGLDRMVRITAISFGSLLFAGLAIVIVLARPKRQ